MADLLKPLHAAGQKNQHASTQRQFQLMQTVAARHATKMRETSQAKKDEINTAVQEIREALQAQPLDAMNAWRDYMIDAHQRWILSLDALRKRGDIFIEHEAKGTPPVLIYDYEVVVDGANLPRPCNYMLLQIVPPEGTEVFNWKRPYVIIDPRAGHGPGIGGFKPDSQVGVALKDGHPVYFVAFKPMPEPGQTLASVTHAEAAFLRHIQKMHPNSPKPVIVGNCQGGWATAILAATNPDLAGPIVLNGAPMSYWSGRLGQDPMRYTGGMAGGVLPVMMLADLGGGVFDGAHLVHNFEALNPARTQFRKYYDLFANIDHGEKRFLEFERWWGGLFLMNEPEIRWIVENLFVGNRLGKNEARLEVGRPIDVKQIRAPIIVFASHGDNITPPQQALNWIVDTYADESEIEIRGQRIIYMVHDEVGHLGIFVSSSVAKREHTQMASTLKTIEALPPGLYEMVIEDMAGEGQDKTFTVSFQKRKMSDILSEGDGRDEEVAFAAVARMSEQLAEIYEVTARPLLQAVISPETGAAMRSMHPMRTQRTAFSSHNPLMTPIAALAEEARAKRQPVDENNPFLKAERLWADMVETGLQATTDWRAMMTELTFLSIYGGPWGQWYGAPYQHQRTHKSPDELRALPEVADALHAMETGGLAEGVVRMLVLLADSRGNVRRDRLERSSEVLTSRPPFSDMDPLSRGRMIHQQTLICHFERDQAMATLPALLSNEADRSKALEIVTYIVGDPAEMTPKTQTAYQQMHGVLGRTLAPQITAAAQ